MANQQVSAEQEKSDISLSCFKIEEVIGVGQFSTVHRAVCKSTGHYIALKRVSLLNLKEGKSSQDCLKEARLLQKLSHSNIIKCFSSFLEDSNLVITLELATVGDVAKMVRDFTTAGYLIPEKTIWHYFSQITCAIEYMHSEKVMHRDIKPANVFITAQNTIKLGDLGLGRVFSPETLQAHSLLGTPFYMSPERVKETGYDFKSDIWSLGCLLYEMAALQPPFFIKESNLSILYHRIENADYIPIPSHSYTKELSYVVNHCLEKDPKMRPDSKFVHSAAIRIYNKILKLTALSLHCFLEPTFMFLCPTAFEIIFEDTGTNKTLRNYLILIAELHIWIFALSEVSRLLNDTMAHGFQKNSIMELCSSTAVP